MCFCNSTSFPYSFHICSLYFQLAWACDPGPRPNFHMIFKVCIILFSLGLHMCAQRTGDFQPVGGSEVQLRTGWLPGPSQEACPTQGLRGSPNRTESNIQISWFTFWPRFSHSRNYLRIWAEQKYNRAVEHVFMHRISTRFLQ